jgi:hypothetical protein
MEYMIEIIDNNGAKVVVRGSSDPTLQAPDHKYSLPQN